MAGRKGKRPRLGRPPGPPEQVRRNRLVLTLRDADLDALRRIADERAMPVGTVAYQILARGLGRVRRSER